MEDFPGFVVDMKQKLRQFAVTGGSAEELGDLHQDNGDPDAGDKPAHDRLGDKFQKTIGFKKKEQEQPGCHKDTDEGHDPHSFPGSGGDPQGTQQGACECGGGCVHTENKPGRAGDQSVYKDRKK